MNTQDILNEILKELNISQEEYLKKEISDFKVQETELLTIFNKHPNEDILLLIKDCVGSLCEVKDTRGFSRVMAFLTIQLLLNNKHKLSPAHQQQLQKLWDVPASATEEQQSFTA